MKVLAEWLDYLEGLHARSIDLNLERIKVVGLRANLFEFRCPVVLVAGTNGKGSTIHALATLLQAANLRVGTYTSPHLCQFNERIQINHQPIETPDLLKSFEAIETLRQNTPLTFFEFTTLAAFHYFQKQQSSLDIILFEIGLGGRLDAVNTLSPDLSIITTIDYDHQEYLGEDLESIAREKAGILRSRKPCVLGKSPMQTKLDGWAQDLNCTRYLAGQDFDWQKEPPRALGNEKGGVWLYQGEPLKIPSFRLPAESLSLALASYRVLRSSILKMPDLPEIVSKIDDIGMPGRFQKIRQNPTVIVDVAHNLQSCTALYERLKNVPIPGKRLAIWAMLADKPIEKIAELFKNSFEAWWVPQLTGQRALATESLVAALKQAGVTTACAVAHPKEALEKAIAQADVEDEIIVFGSFYTVGEVLSSNI